jgi:hypothetical protein
MAAGGRPSKILREWFLSDEQQKRQNAPYSEIKGDSK